MIIARQQSGFDSCLQRPMNIIDFLLPRLSASAAPPDDGGDAHLQ
jgi:hypothetical protein